MKKQREVEQREDREEMTRRKKGWVEGKEENEGRKRRRGEREREGGKKNERERGEERQDKK